MKFYIFIAFILSVLIADNNFCTLPDIDNHPIISSSRSLYDIGDTISTDDQQRPYNVCYSDNNYFVGDTFTFNDFNGYENGGNFNIIIISMNATW